MDWLAISLGVVGLGLLVGGAELLVRGSARLAAALGISPLVVGLTVVAFGTSAPELAVSLTSSFSGVPSLALGNVIGSNICNTLLILGVSAAVAPLVVGSKLVRLEVPIMVGVTALVWALGANGVIGRFEGLLLFGGIVGYTVYAIVQSRRESQAARDEFAEEFGEAKLTPKFVAVQLTFFVVGLFLLVTGSNWMVEAAVGVARYFGISEMVIGLTIVAFGTSLPELATSAVASMKGERDIAVGNIVGSNLFNLMAVLGATAAVAPGGVPVPEAALAFDIPVMLAVSVACLPIFFSGSQISRGEGALFLGYYVAYLTFLVLDATQHTALGGFTTVMLYGAIPLTAVGLLASFVLERRRGSGGGEPTASA